MAVILDMTSLKAYIKGKCQSELKTTSDFDLELALKRQLIFRSSDWTDLASDVIAARLDPNLPVVEANSALYARLSQFTDSVVTSVKSTSTISQTERAVSQRFIREYFFPKLGEEQKHSSVLLEKVKQALAMDPEDTGLKQYESLLENHVAYIDSMIALPLVIEKMVTALSATHNANYTPRKNAEVVAGLLNTIQQSQKGQWTIETLLEALKVVADVTMPDLPVDAITLETISELLAYLNDTITKGQELEEHKKVFFSDASPTIRDARKALLATMNIKFDSLSQICKDTLAKPIDESLEALSALGETVNTMFPGEEGTDILKILSAVDQSLGMIHHMPDELSGFVPAGARSAIGAYQSIKGLASSVAGGLSYAATTSARFLNELGEKAPAKVKAAFAAMTDIAASTITMVGPAISKVASAVGYVVPLSSIPILGSMINRQTLRTITKKAADAAFALIPSAVIDRMKPRAENDFWTSIKYEGAIDPNVAEAYLSFYELARDSNQSQLEETFFNSYMSAHQAVGPVAYDYQEYKTFTQNIDPDLFTIPTTDCLAIVGKTTKEETYNMALYMRHRLNHLEQQITKVDDLKPTLTELKNCLQFESDNPCIKSFQELYTQTAVEKSLLAYEKNQFNPMLEKLIDNNPGNTSLRDIYSKLKAGQLLSNVDLIALKNVSEQHDDIKFPIHQMIEDLTQDLGPRTTITDIPKSLTPKEESRQTIQAVLDYLEPICRDVANNWKNQLNSCEQLRVLCPSDPIKSLCESKIDYLQALQKCNDQLIADIRNEGILAEQIRVIISGEAATDLYNTTDVKKIAKQMISATWNVMLPKDEMTDASLPEKILAHALSTNRYLGGLTEAKKIFEGRCNSTPPPPELIGELGNPMGGVSDNVIKNLQRKGADALISSGLNLYEGLRTYHVQYWLASTAMAYVFPQALLIEVATELLIRPSIQEKIGIYLQPVIRFMKPITDRVIGILGFVSDQTKALTNGIKDLICQRLNIDGQIFDTNISGMIKDRVYPMLDIEVQKILQAKARDYAKATPAERLAMNKGEREAFSGYYLQYRAIKKDNQSLDKAECIKYLFQSYLETNTTTAQTVITDQFSRAFDELDGLLEIPPTEVASREQNAGHLENELHFLIDTVDFDSPDERALVTMTIYNRLVMMQFEASKQLSQTESRKLQQKAVEIVGSVLQNLERADAARLNPVNRDNLKTNQQLAQMAPAIKIASQNKLNELQSELEKTITLVDSGIRDRHEQINAEQNINEPDFLGKTVLEAEISKSTNSNLAFKIGRAILKIVTPALFWVTISLALSKDILTVILTAIGIAGTTAGTVATAGLFMAAASFALWVGVNTLKEVRRQSNEFDVINASNKSPAQKFGLKILTGLKCFGIGLVKAVMIDTIYNYVSRLFNKSIKSVINLAQNIRDLVRAHPEQQTLNTEIESLELLKETLQEYKALVDAQIEDKKKINYDVGKPNRNDFKTQVEYDKELKIHNEIDERARLIQRRAQEISVSMENLVESLRVSSGSDSRWSGGEYKELDRYKAVFAQLNETMEQVGTIQKLEFRMPPRNSAVNEVSHQDADVFVDFPEESGAAEEDINQDEDVFVDFPEESGAAEEDINQDEDVFVDFPEEFGAVEEGVDASNGPERGDSGIHSNEETHGVSEHVKYQNYRNTIAVLRQSSTLPVKVLVEEDDYSDDEGSKLGKN